MIPATAALTHRVVAQATVSELLGRVFLTVFIISYFFRLTSRFPVLGAVRFDFFLGGFILICILFSPLPDKLRGNIEVSRRLRYFFLFIILSLPLVTWPGSVIRFHLIEWIKVFLLFIFVVVMVRTVGQLKWVFGVFLTCQAVRVLEPLYLHLTTGYWGSQAFSTIGGLSRLDRLSGAPHDVVNPTQLGWVIVNTVPFLWYLLWKSGRFGKVLALLATPPFLYCFLLTGSRSGLLSLIFVLLAIVFFTKNRSKNLLVALIIGIPVAIFSFSSIGGDMQTRYLSLVDSNVAGADTAKGRVDGLIRGIGSISNNPLFGNGLGTSRETNFNIVGGRAQITHNLYLEVFQETGLIGFTLFMMFIVAMFKSLVETKRLLLSSGRDETDWLFRMATAVQVWVVMDLFYSLSCFGLRSWEWYFFGGVATVCLALAREHFVTQAVPERVNINKNSGAFRLTLQFSGSERRK